MIYSSLQVKFEGTKPNGRIQRYVASIFGDIIIKVSKSININLRGPSLTVVSKGMGHL